MMVVSHVLWKVAEQHYRSSNSSSPSTHPKTLKPSHSDSKAQPDWKRLRNRKPQRKRQNGILVGPSPMLLESEVH